MIEIKNAYGITDLSVIDPKKVEHLSPEAATALAVLITCVQRREAATERMVKATRAKAEAEAAHDACLALHTQRNPPVTFQQALQAAQAAYQKSSN